MATLWVVRKKHVNDPLAATLGSLRQAFVARLAEKHGLQVAYEEYEDEWVDMAVQGPIERLLVLIQECAGANLAGFVVDLEREEQAAESALESVNERFPLVEITKY